MYAFQPNQQSGKYMRHLNTVLPSAGPFYYAAIPLTPKGGETRVCKEIPFSFIPERLRDEVESGDTLERLHAAESNGQEVWDTQAYQEHPVVRSLESQGKLRPIPIGVYVDGVRYTSQIGAKTDNVIAWWVINLVSQRRHLAGFVRSTDVCKCGCGGWDTYHAVLSVLECMLFWSQSGKIGATRHDGSNWRATDLLPSVTSYKFQTAVLWIKGDWAEHSKTLGCRFY